MAKNIELELGAHMSAAGGVENALLIAQKANCQCVQLFSANQRQWKAKQLTQDQIDLFKSTYKETGLKTLVVHASYLINLAAINDETLDKSIQALKDELTRCDQLGIHYLVMHPGAHMKAGVESGLEKIVKSLDEVFKTNWQVQLLLETTAGQGSSLGCEFEHLAYIRENVKRPEALGVCLDTCHIYAAGYDIKSPENYKTVMKDFNKIVGLDNLKVLHVNDSKKPLGSKVDRHDHLGKGELGKQAFINLMTDKRITKLPLILETPKGTSPGGKDYDLINLAALRRYAK